MEQSNAEVQKKYEELALLQKERVILKAKNAEAKANYPGN
jgi:hypothetical protein